MQVCNTGPLSPFCPPPLQSFLYGERVDHVTYTEFVNKELILFSNADNERSIPSLVDGEPHHTTTQH